jgi:murein DD-endopeptidase MepM/ murein hydrolase activator NlpD
VYRLCNALPRAVLVLSVALLCCLSFGTTARADDPTPRAVPQARAYPRSFDTYDEVIAYATDVAAQQSALDVRLAAVRAQGQRVAQELVAIAPETPRGGSLFDIDAQTSGRALVASLHTQTNTIATTQRSLIAAGALTSEAAPWRMPTDGEITQPFGPTDVWVEPARDYDGVAYAHFHDGVDIAGAWMADVVAPARGRVVFVGRMMDGAEIVVLAHDGGLVTMYAHLDAWESPPTVAPGDEVAAGQKIGTVGLTGITTGMHLHWAAWRNGQLTDPMALVGH